MRYKIGSKVIYPAHGTAKIVGRSTREVGGQKVKYLELLVPERGFGVSGDMKISVPEAKAAELGVRDAISSEEAEEVLAVLAVTNVRVPTNWSRRFKNHQEKLKSGDVYQVAEVVRNLAARNRDASLSAAERTMYDRARINLISEIAPALKVSAEDAEKYLDEALAKGVLKPAKDAKKKA